MESAWSRRCARCSTSDEVVTPIGRGPRRTFPAARHAGIAPGAVAGAARGRSSRRAARARRGASPSSCRRRGRPRRCPDRSARWARRVREGDTAGRARRPCRPGRALRQGPAVGHPARPGAGVRARTSRSSRRPRRLPPSRPVDRRHRGNGFGASPGPAGVAASRPHLLRPARQHGDQAGAGARRWVRACSPCAALERLGLTAHVAEVLDTRTLLPQVGQGALAVECRPDDDGRARAPRRGRRQRRPRRRAGRTRLPGRARRRAARCRWGRWPSSTTVATQLTIDGFLASRDGRILLRRSLTGPASDPEELGRRLTARPARRLRGPVPRRLGRMPRIGPPGPGPSRGAAAVTVYLVGAGPGDPGLLTRRGAELLGQSRRRPLRPVGRPPAARAGARPTRCASTSASGPASFATRTRSTPCSSSTPDSARPSSGSKEETPSCSGAVARKPKLLLSRRDRLRGGPRRHVGLRGTGRGGRAGHPPGTVVVGDGGERARRATPTRPARWTGPRWPGPAAPWSS